MFSNIYISVFIALLFVLSGAIWCFSIPVYPNKIIASVAETTSKAIRKASEERKYRFFWEFYLGFFLSCLLVEFMIIYLNNLPAPELMPIPRSAIPQNLKWPLTARATLVTEHYSNSGGALILTNKDSEIKSSIDGTVIYCGGLEEFGNVIIVKSDAGLIVSFGYIRECDLKRGDYILAGQDVGRTTDKFYIDVRYDGRKIDIASLFLF